MIMEMIMGASPKYVLGEHCFIVSFSNMTALSWADYHILFTSTIFKMKSEFFSHQHAYNFVTAMEIIILLFYIVDSTNNTQVMFTNFNK